MENLSSVEINTLRTNARNVVRELGLLNDAYFDIGVTLAERHLLIELNSCLYPTVGDIAERLLLDKSTVSRLITKAFKKGYIKYATDDNDKRKRFLQFTEIGRNVLNAFDPIAFNQTKEALLTLTPDEINTVYRGIELYAKGLKNSRLRQKITVAEILVQDNAGLAHLFTEVHKGSSFLKSIEDNQHFRLENLFETYQKKGSSYFVMKMESKIIGGAGISPYECSDLHICQLEKICMHPEMHDLGFEKILIDFCIKEATQIGYKQCYVDIEKEAQFPPNLFQKQGFQALKNNKQNESLLWKTC
ncbi:MAG: MarR family transcriptional regulator [Parachlamydiaceae bacterium]|nr:MarR family transcriptional regulator [Parachlamydiaceae bacterium]